MPGGRIRKGAFLALLLAGQLTLAQVDQCADACSAYNELLDSCQHDADQNDVWLSCVCNDSTFQSSNAQCVQCEGSGSAPDKVRQNCANVGPDCDVACQDFSQVLEGCGDTSTDEGINCVCSGAYDINYSGTFNQAFNDCASCATGGGRAGEWEQICCQKTGGCSGMSSNIQSSSVSPNPTTTTTGGGGGGNNPSTSPSPTTTTTINNGGGSSGGGGGGGSGGGGSVGGTAPDTLASWFGSALLALVAAVVPL